MLYVVLIFILEKKEWVMYMFYKKINHLMSLS
mgnify:CR=1 FL=1